jgi:hypothetical protein
VGEYSNFSSLSRELDPIDCNDKVYERVISKFKWNEGWLEEINYDTEVNNYYPLSPTPFQIFILGKL